jgi:hypothetical protein
MTPEERAVYEQGGGAASTSSSDGVTATPDQVAALDFSTISHPFSGASCVFSTVAEMSDNLGGNDYGEDAIRFGIDGKLVEFEPYGSVSKEGTGFRSRHSLPIYLTIRDIVDVGKTEEEYGFPASQWLVEVTLEQGSNKRVHQIYRFCGDG